MPSVANDLREEQIRETLAMTPDARVALLIRLSEDALQFFMAAQHLSREEAIAEIERRRRAGRRSSGCMDSR